MPPRCRARDDRRRCRVGASAARPWLAAVGAAGADRRARAPARARRRCRASSCSSCSRRRRLGGRRTLAGACRRDRRLPARQLVLHAAPLHVHDQRGREPACARRVPRRRGDRQRLRRARRAARSRGAAMRAPRPRALAPSRRLVPGLRLSSTASTARLGLDGAAVLHRHEQRLAHRGSEPAIASGTARRQRPRQSTSTTSMFSRSPGRRSASDDRRVLDAFVTELAASVELGELEAEAADSGTPRRRRTTCGRPSSRPSRTTSARRSAAIKASVTSLLQDDIDWTPEAQREFLNTIDEETDRLNALVGNLLDMSRLQAGALEIRARAGRARRGRPGSAPRASDAPTTDRRSTSPETLPRVLADAGAARACAREPDHERCCATRRRSAGRASRPGQSTESSTSGSWTAARVCRADRARAALPAVPAARRLRAEARASGSGSRSRRDSSRRWAARSSSRTLPAAV